LLKGEIAGRQS